VTTLPGINGNQLVAYNSIPLTLGSKQYGFGGKQESIDHIKGNKGEAWHVVVSLDEEKVFESIHKTTKIIIVVGIVFTFFVALMSLLLGKWIAIPIIKLSTKARLIGEGDFDTQSSINSNDEIGSLSNSLNKMVRNLKDTTASRDELLHEIELRKKTEEEREKVIQELKEALKKVKVLSGLLPICSHCKKIRDDNGYWKQIEHYIYEHSEAEFSHSICQECARKYYPDYDVFDE